MDCITNQKDNILWFLPNDTLIEVFIYLGASGTARCSMVCQDWKEVSNKSVALWHHFIKEDFNIDLKEKNNINKEDNTTVEWGDIYRYISSRLIISLRRNVKERRLPVRIIFADGGLKHGTSYESYYPPENVFDPQKGAWCTNAGVDKNVDLVAELPTSCLVTGFLAENGSYEYSAPLKEALVFTSFEEPPDLEIAKSYYNDEKGSKYVTELISNRGFKSISKTPTSRSYIIAKEKNAVSDKILNNAVKPVAAFQFPSHYELCINTLIQFNCTAIARYVHFKLLSSLHPSGMFSTNIDLLNLAVLGIDLPQLPIMLNSRKRCCPDPSYERMHK